MRAILFTLAVFAALAAEPDARILRLITPTVQSVSGSDEGRLRSTRLAARLVSSDGAPEDSRVRQSVTITYRDNREMTVSLGAFHFAFEPGVKFEGPPDLVRAAQAAWRAPAGGIVPLAQKARELGGSYDSWVVSLYPLRSDEWKDLIPVPLASLDRFRDSMTEFSAGIRYGAVHQVHAWARFARSEDAWAAGSIVSLLPAIGKRSESGGVAEVCEAIEDLQTRRNGSLLEVTFSLPDDKFDAGHK
ncbi:MAG: hypothetical protein HYX27_27510 [Acidobacteria bacterium]|nr:hypothetical protein [Acidobacteriota bacterium]